MNNLRITVDYEACWGCRTCEVACKQENKAPDGVRLITVTEDGPEFPAGNPAFSFRVNLCRHCDDPPCVAACPVEAISQREDGLVILDTAACSGCSLCLGACPFQAIAFDEQEGKAYKCNLCAHRVDQGLIPACADNVCEGHCIYFGPADRLDQMMAEKSLLQERLAADPRR
ncbi:MAG: 4Fe-4S binding protein [Desulfobacterota bacterium]|nr:4Fe-4S binding protein [Thermodesulfobacteriota bacterium]